MIVKMESEEKLQSHTSRSIQKLPDWLLRANQRVERELNKQLHSFAGVADYLQQAMEYALFNGGKRIRAALVFSLEPNFNIPAEVLDAIAAAIECVHTSSLIHDDLPALDNDDLRRGKPACHIAFNEAIAILAGDALLNLAHQIILNMPTSLVSALHITQLGKILAESIGTRGLIGGQALEFELEPKPLDENQLLELYQLKTGCLLSAGLKMVLQLTNIASEKKYSLEQFMQHLGLAFQIKDDILDVESNTELLGKPQHSDSEMNKITSVSLLGLNQAKELLNLHWSKAKACLAATGLETKPLLQIGKFIIERVY